MTFVGKLLVLLQIVFSLVFMAFAAVVYTGQTNWRKAAADFEQRVVEERKKGDAVLAEFDTYKKDAAARLEAEQQAAGAARAEATNLDARVRALTADLDAAKTELAQAQFESGIAIEEQKFWQNLSKQHEEIAERNRSALDKANRQLRDLMDQLFAKDADLASIVRKAEETFKENAELQRIITVSGIDTSPEALRDKKAPPPSVGGLVLNSKRGDTSGSEYVEISIGADDGLKKGDGLYVYRETGGGKYLGRLELVMVTPDRSVGRVVEKSKNSTIQRGDNVATRLN